MATRPATTPRGSNPGSTDVSRTKLLTSSAALSRDERYVPAMIVMDAVSRLLPGTLGNPASAVEESHLDGLLDYPHYTRPENTAVGGVPAVLMSGDHGAIQRWRRKEALWRTWQRRPDLLANRPLSEEEQKLLAELFELD